MSANPAGTNAFATYGTPPGSPPYGGGLGLRTADPAAGGQIGTSVQAPLGAYSPWQGQVPLWLSSALGMSSMPIQNYPITNFGRWNYGSSPYGSPMPSPAPGGNPQTPPTGGGAPPTTGGGGNPQTPPTTPPTQPPVIQPPAPGVTRSPWTPPAGVGLTPYNNIDYGNGQMSALPSFRAGGGGQHLQQAQEQNAGISPIMRQVYQRMLAQRGGQ